MARLRRLAAFVLAAAISAAGLQAAGPAAASTSDAAFDPATGALNVDYGSYLSQHDVVYRMPNSSPASGLTVGTGTMGAMVWNENGLTMQVAGVDDSEQSTYAAGRVNLRSTPGMDTGYTTFKQRLSLYDGTLTTTYDSDRTVTVMGSPKSNVMGIHVHDTRSNVSSVSLDLSIWDPAKVANIADVPNLKTWQTVSTFAGQKSAGFSRGQDDPHNFGYTMAATVDGASYTTQVVDATKVRLTITPSTDYTIWIADANRFTAPGHDSVTQAANLLDSVKSAGYGATLTAFQDFWHSFWAKSFVRYSNGAGDADYMENAYYLGTYMIAAGSYGVNPFHFINGVFRATGDETKWSNGYWGFNMRDVYDSFLASNHPDLMNVFNSLYARNYDTLKANTKARYGVEGLWVPETMGWDGNNRGTVNSDFTADILTTGTEVVNNMYAQYEYTGDTAYLKNTAYPMMRDVATFYANTLSFNSATGLYYMASSNADETYWDVPNAITDLAAIRSLFPNVIKVGKQFGTDSDLRGRLQNILDHLTPYPTDGSVYLPHTPPITPRKNGENVPNELIWPFGVTGIGAADFKVALETWNTRPAPYGNIWAPDAIQAARLGQGDAVFKGMKKMLTQYQTLPNGMTTNTNGVFEAPGVHLISMNEALLQSYDGRIRVFPAVPTDSTFSSAFTLAASGGFLVSSERESGQVKYVGVKSRNGNTAVVVNPWGTQQAQVRRVSDNAVVTTTSAKEITFPTTAGGVYVVERTAEPFGSYTRTRLTGTANQDARYLPGTSAALGLSTAPNPLVNDDALTYESGWSHAMNRGVGDLNDDVHISTTPGAVATYTFDGTGIRYLSEKNGDEGSVDVYIDGVFQKTVDLKASTRQVQQVVFEKTGLSEGRHTVKVVNGSGLGMIDGMYVISPANPAPGGSTGGGSSNPLVNDDALTYDAAWVHARNRGVGDLNDDVHHTMTPGAVATYTFTGTGIRYLSEKNGDEGSVDVYIDGVFQKTVDLKASTRQVQQVVFEKTGLTAGEHTFKLVNGSGLGMIDALYVISATGGQTGGATAPTGRITGYGGKCADVAGAATTNGTAVQLYDCNDTAAQKWTMATDGTIRALGKCMHLQGSGTANGTKVELRDCTGSAAQKWSYTSSSRALRNPQSGRCLDATGPSSANGTRLQIWDCGGSANQQWTVPAA